MKRRGRLKRHTPLVRGKRVSRMNKERRAAKYARNFGDEAAAVRAMPCLACRNPPPKVGRATGSVQATHVTARGMGGAKGTRLDLVPLCARHHSEAGEARTSARAEFEARYGLDLRAIADEIALAHEPPLGIRGLAKRWAFWHTGDPNMERQARHGPLSEVELAALLGWVRREAEREVERRRASYGVGSPPSLEEIGRRRYYANDREALVQHIAYALWGGKEDTSGVWTISLDSGRGEALCEAAGWPSKEGE